MPALKKSQRLKKELSLFNIYTIATGSTIASGFFLLPGIATAAAGPAVVLSYLIAALPLIPALMSKAELSTAMPRAGGVYYFLDRSMGPLMGTIGGLGTWVALILKSTFALVGMGAYVNIFLPDIPMLPLAVGFAVLFGIVNLFGVKKTGTFQAALVVSLLLLLLWFTGTGIPVMQPSHFNGFFDAGLENIFSTAGLVYVSYVGLTKIASVSEEVKDPEKNIPLAMFLALGTAILVYIFGISVIVGVLPASELHHDLTPVASAAYKIAGQGGAILMTVAAILAFFSVANAGILSASRYPLAMSRDFLMPRFLSHLTRFQTPDKAIFLSVALIIFSLTMFDALKIAKLASAFQLLLFALNCLAVIVMRESKLDSYDPGYKSPFYPWLHIVGFILPLLLISFMGWLPILSIFVFFALGSAWYYYYGRGKVVRDGAIFHIFARLGELRYEGLDRELRGILIEKGLREEDPFDAVIASATLIDKTGNVSFEDVDEEAVAKFEKHFPGKGNILKEGFLQGTRLGMTPVSKGVALPHMRLPDIKTPEMVMVRTKIGVDIDIDTDYLGPHATKNQVFAFFFLISPEENPGQHLRILAQIAGRAEDATFLSQWSAARNEQELKEIVLRDDRFFSLVLHRDSPLSAWVDQHIFDLNLPTGSLITMIHRKDEILVPRGRTVLHEGDRLTIIGDPTGIRELRSTYATAKKNRDQKNAT